MSKIRITKEFKFEMAHALMGYDGPCRNIHGHSYYLYVTIAGEPLNQPGHPKNGMVMDFSVLKEIVNREVIKKLDHSLVLNNQTPSAETDALRSFHNIVLLPYQPTCENLVADFAVRLKALLPAGVILHSLRLSETVTSYAEWFSYDND